MNVLCLDLEGCWVPEIWINVSEKTGIDELKITTRDEPDFIKLMKRRIQILKENNLKLKDIQNVISNMSPFEGAKETMDWLRSRTQVVIVSDVSKQLAGPLMKQLDYPTIFCNTLKIDKDDNIVGFKLRQEDQKRKVVQALKSLDYNVIACGDSYNDMSMLKEADQGFLLFPPENIVKEFPDFPVFKNYDELKKEILKLI